MKNPREYYDRFSKGYDQRRDKGYHALLDELESETVRRHISSGRLLDAGCGTGLISRRLRTTFPRIVGADLSLGMLRHARERGQIVIEANLDSLPFKDQVFDGLFSFKVLAHIPDLSRTLMELKRVVKPGGTLVLEFYNPRSLRGLKKKFRLRHRVAADTDETEIYTAFHSLPAIRKILPAGLVVEEVKGVMIFTPMAICHRIPGIAPLLRYLERRFSNSCLKCYAGFLVVAAKNKS